jgi:hypothetical protein
MGVREVRTGESWSRWVDELPRPLLPDYRPDRDLVVAYFASAEWECFLELGEPLPEHVLCLHAEYRRLSNGLGRQNSFRDALEFFGLQGSWTADKHDSQMLAATGGPFTAAQKQRLLDYVLEDAMETERLLLAMAPQLQDRQVWIHALQRGDYTRSVARMIRKGIPIDLDTHGRLVKGWDQIKSHLIVDIDRQYRVFRPVQAKKVGVTGNGAKLHEAARRAGVDVHQLSVVVDELWASKYAEQREFARALKHARKATGLTPAKIAKWQGSGRDHSTWVGLDVAATELAREWPVLGLATSGESRDGAARLFGLLADPPAAMDKYSEGVLDDAAELLASGQFDLKTIHWGFSLTAFEDYLRRTRKTWERTATGRLRLDEDTFKQKEKADPDIAPLRQLLASLGKMRLFRQIPETALP